MGRAPGSRWKNTQPLVSVRTRGVSAGSFSTVGREVGICSPPLTSSRKPPVGPVASIIVVTSVKDTSMPSSSPAPSLRFITARLSARGVMVAPLAISGAPSSAAPGRIDIGESAGLGSSALPVAAATLVGVGLSGAGPYEQPATRTAATTAPTSFMVVILTHPR